MTGELDEKKTQIKILQQTLQVAYTLIMYIYNIFMSTYLRAGFFTLQNMSVSLLRKLLNFLQYGKKLQE